MYSIYTKFFELLEDLADAASSKNLKSGFVTTAGRMLEEWHDNTWDQMDDRQKYRALQSIDNLMLGQAGLIYGLESVLDVPDKVKLSEFMRERSILASHLAQVLELPLGQEPLGLPDPVATKRRDVPRISSPAAAAPQRELSEDETKLYSLLRSICDKIATNAYHKAPVLYLIQAFTKNEWTRLDSVNQNHRLSFLLSPETRKGLLEHEEGVSIVQVAEKLFSANNS